MVGGVFCLALAGGAAFYMKGKRNDSSEEGGNESKVKKSMEKRKKVAELGTIRTDGTVGTGSGIEFGNEDGNNYAAIAAASPTGGTTTPGNFSDGEMNAKNNNNDNLALPATGMTTAAQLVAMAEAANITPMGNGTDLSQGNASVNMNGNEENDSDSSDSMIAMAQIRSQMMANQNGMKTVDSNNIAAAASTTNVMPMQPANLMAPVQSLSYGYNSNSENVSRENSHGNNSNSNMNINNNNNGGNYYSSNNNNNNNSNMAFGGNNMGMMNNINDMAFNNYNNFGGINNNNNNNNNMNSNYNNNGMNGMNLSDMNNMYGGSDLNLEHDDDEKQEILDEEDNLNLDGITPMGF